MSFEAVAWALEAPVGGTQKVVLIGIASHADKHGDNAWPSIETLAGYAYVTTRAVQMAINELVGAGLLFKGLNEGGNRQTAAHMRPNLYRLNMAKKTGDQAAVLAAPPEASFTPPPEASFTPPPEASFTPPPEASFTTPLKPASPPPLKPASPEQSIEPSLNHTGNTSARKRALSRHAPQHVTVPGDVDQQVFADWLALRSSKGAGPVTATVLAGMRNEAARAGLSLSDAIAHCCLAGWQGFKAAWFDRQQGNGGALPVGGGRGGRGGAGSRQGLVAGAAAAIFDGATHV